MPPKKKASAAAGPVEVSPSKPAPAENVSISSYILQTDSNHAPRLESQKLVDKMLVQTIQNASVQEPRKLPQRPNLIHMRGRMYVSKCAGRNPL
jgi:hypothetical protein